MSCRSKGQSNIMPSQLLTLETVTYGVAGFKDALRFYRTNGQVNAYNREHLEKIQKPIINIACSSTDRRSNNADSRDAGNLQQQLSLCVGVRVMLTENLWTHPRGL
ncbi:hypothetical protein E4U19_003017 [Claviceps sp. Clav32 group G5]|nr:hypothetical protein E4U19_003017 [Claviceps sp. Clav32 group G5]